MARSSDQRWNQADPYGASDPYGAQGAYAASHGAQAPRRPVAGGHYAPDAQPDGPRLAGQGDGRRRRRGPAIAAGIGLLAGGLVAGALAGVFLIGPRLSLPQTPVAATLTASQLDEVVGHYTYDGKVYEITARDAIDDAVSLDSRKNDDGTYDTPTADMIFAYARNRILAAEVQKAGVTVSADDLAAYERDFAGTTDVATIARLYSMDEDQATRLLTEAAGVRKLRDQVTSGATAAPEAPKAPEDGDTEVTNATYAAYVIGLLGSHWDAAHGTWLDTDNDYYAALADLPLSPTSASYETALAAYGVAYAQYLASGKTASELWDDYVNQFMDKAAVTIDTLRS